jgi:hypothetical protein
METKIKNGLIIISIPLQEPKLSISGRSLVVATSRGKQRTAVKVGGKTVFVVANAFLEVDVANGADSVKTKATQGKK